MANLIQEATHKIVNPEFLRSAAKQSERCLVVPFRLRRAIKGFLREQAEPHLKRKVQRLSETFNGIKEKQLLLVETTSQEAEELFSSKDSRDQRWKIKSSYGDIGFTYSDDETLAYVASRMPAVYSACYRVLSEVRRRLPDFAPAKVLDFGAGTGSAFWAMREVWPKSVEKMNVVEPSQSMQRAGRSLIQDMKGLPLIQGYQSIVSLTKDIKKSEREHDLVIASYVLGEIPSVKDRISTVRQLWGLTRDVLVLIEPGTPHGFEIISLMRSHILWMEKRKCRKAKKKDAESCKDLVDLKSGAFVVAPCAHDGRCPLEKSGKYCHFAQRLQRTSSQRAYKRFNGEPLRGFEDEKFSFVVLRKGQRPREPWPLDGVQFETLREQHDRRKPEDLEIDYEDETERSQDEDDDDNDDDNIPRAVQRVGYESDIMELDTLEDSEEEPDEQAYASLGGGWGRIMFMPVRRGKRVTVDVCRSVNQEASEGSLERFVVTKGKNPTLHHLARKSYWGDLWPY